MQTSARKNWHDKCAKKVHAKLGTLNVQKSTRKAVSKFADLIRVHKNKCTLMLTKRSAHATWLVLFCTFNVPSW